MQFFSYAQNFEDVILWRALKHIKSGFYIDVGASEPTADSITRAFYDHDWCGINIEPSLATYTRLSAERLRDINLPIALAEKEGLLTFFENSTQGLSTINEVLAEKYKQSGQIVSQRMIAIKTLNQVCEEHVKGPIHFLKIDVEGAETEVLKGIDLRVWRPWILIIEAVCPNSTISAHHDWENIVTSSNYVFAYFDGLNRYYVANEHKNLLPSFSVPPNLFDEFKLYEGHCLSFPLNKFHEREQQLTQLLAESETAQAARLKSIECLSALLAKSEAARAARLKPIEYLSAFLNKLPTYTIFRRFQWGKRLVALKQIEKNTKLQTIAVDLTPILPGGENGGAKIFVLELLSQLASLAPETQFILLTQAASHDELRIMERKNMTRLQLTQSSINQPGWLLGAIRIYRLLPFLQKKIDQFACRVHNLIKRRGTGHSLLHTIKADLLFCPFTAPTYALPEVPTVCTIYDLQYKTHPSFFTSEDVAHRHFTFIEACRRATRLIAISEYSRKSAITHGELAPDIIQTIHLRMGQRILVKTDQDQTILNTLRLKSQEYLLYPANFWKHKNHEMLLTAFGIACHAGLNDQIKLVFTGTASARQASLMAAARRMKLDHRVIFPGFLTNDELAVLMSNCGGMVFPSLYEGFGLPVIEAMAAGIPVACSNITSLPEVASSAAIQFDPRIPTQIADAMVSLLNDHVLRKKLIRAGLVRAAEFADSRRMAEEYWCVFQDAIHTKRINLDLLLGNHVDGWAPHAMQVQVEENNNNQHLEMEFFAPEWLPHAKITITAHLIGQKKKTKINVLRGENSLLSVPLSSAGGYYDISISPTFIPSQCAPDNPDQRELSLMLRRCGIRRNNDEYITLFTEEQTA